MDLQNSFLLPLPTFVFLPVSVKRKKSGANIIHERFESFSLFFNILFETGRFLIFLLVFLLLLKLVMVYGIMDYGINKISCYNNNSIILGPPSNVLFQLVLIS